MEYNIYYIIPLGSNYGVFVENNRAYTVILQYCYVKQYAKWIVLIAGQSKNLHHVLLQEIYKITNLCFQKLLMQMFHSRLFHNKLIINLKAHNHFVS